MFLEFYTTSGLAELIIQCSHSRLNQCVADIHNLQRDSFVNISRMHAKNENVIRLSESYSI